MALLSLSTLLALLPKVGPAVAAAKEFKALWDQGVATLKPADQETAKEGYQDLIADNAEGFARLDAKLEAAKNR